MSVRRNRYRRGFSTPLPSVSGSIPSVESAPVQTPESTPEQPSPQGGMMETSTGSGSSRAAEGRPTGRPTGTTLLECQGNNSFRPHEAVRDITDILKGHWTAPLVMFSEASREQVDQWFDRFKTLYTWPAENDYAIRTRFNSVAAKRTRTLMADLRARSSRGDAPPHWIKPEFWPVMQAKWSDTRMREISEINKANRAKSDAHYSGGTIPTSVHRQRLEAERGGSVDALTLFVHTHSRRATGQLVDQRAANTVEAYRNEQARYQSTDGSGSSSSQPDSFQIWGETVGGRKKGRVYGLGSEASSFTPDAPTGHSPGPAQSAQRDAELERLREELAARQAELAAREASEERMRLQMEEMMQRQRTQDSRLERLERLEQLIVSATAREEVPPPPPDTRAPPLDLSEDQIRQFFGRQSRS